MVRCLELNDGDCTEAFRSCFNVNFNILFKAILLCVRWLIKNFDNIKMHGTTVKKKMICEYPDALLHQALSALPVSKFNMHLGARCSPGLETPPGCQIVEVME